MIISYIGLFKYSKLIIRHFEDNNIQLLWILKEKTIVLLIKKIKTKLTLSFYYIWHIFRFLKLDLSWSKVGSKIKQLIILQIQSCSKHTCFVHTCSTVQDCKSVFLTFFLRSRRYWFHIWYIVLCMYDLLN